jgi:hypothetical protein
MLLAGLGRPVALFDKYGAALDRVITALIRAHRQRGSTRLVTGDSRSGRWREST